MKIAVIGASGNAGSRIIAELARRGHSVTAIARHPDRIASLANVTVKEGDVHGPGRPCRACSPATTPRSVPSISSTAIRPS